MRESKRRKRRESPIGLWTLVALVIANMIGSGLYTSSCYSILGLGEARYVLIVWGLGGVMALCGAIAYGALASRLPMGGGEYLYLSRLIHPFVGSLAGWISLVAGFTAPIAASALIVGKYTVPAFGPYWIQGVASLTIVLAAIAHAVHLQTGAWLQNVIVLLKVVCLVLFLVVGVTFGPEQGWQSGSLTPLPLEGASFWTILAAMMGSLVWISLSYTGFNAAIYLAGELPEGDKRIPLSMWMATLIVTFLYVALNAVFLYAIPAKELAGNEEFVAIVARAIGGGSLEGMVRFAIVISSATAVLAMLMAGPRVYAQMAADGVMPKLFAARKRIPRWAIAVQAGLSLIVVWVAQLQQLITYLGLTLSACGALAIASIWWLPLRMPHSPKVRWYEHVCAAIFVGFSVVLLVAAYADPNKKSEFWACVITFGVGALIHVFMLARKRS
ncbi:MAG: APC family permease [Pirellulales bacterium]